MYSQTTALDQSSPEDQRAAVVSLYLHEDQIQN